jgi:murein DD-endopeptidase MepM/ murein hydrolase activator NlpD
VLWPFWTFLTFLLAAPHPVAALRVAPAAPRQGQALFVSAPGLPPGARAVLSWDGRQYRMYPLASEWRGVIPLRVEERPGVHAVRVTYRGPAGGQRALTQTVNVGRTPVRIQHLSMPRSIERLYTYPGRKKELATVRRALLTETPAESWDGNFLIPIHGRYTTWFGERRIRNGRVVGTHMGLDIAAPTGTPIRADNAGRVVLARALVMHGTTVVIDHGLGVTSIFLHQSALRCHEGQRVHRGDVIGLVGQTGVATGPHLHWGVYVHGTPVSPLFWTRLPRL